MAANKPRSRGKHYESYMRERRRVQSFLRRAKKRGYVFGDDVLPDIPKRITEASVRRLQRLTPAALYKKALYVTDATTGEVVGGLEGRAIERSRAAKKAAARRKGVAPAAQGQFEGYEGYGAPQDLVNRQSYEYLPREDLMIIDSFRARIERSAKESAENPRIDYPAYQMQLLAEWESMFSPELIAAVLKEAWDGKPEGNVIDESFFLYESQAQRVTPQLADLFLKHGLVSREQRERLGDMMEGQDEFVLY